MASFFPAKLKASRGLGLIEVMVAIVVFSLVFLPVPLLVTQYYQITVATGQGDIGIRLAQKKMEEVKCQGAITERSGDFASVSLPDYSFEITGANGEQLPERLDEGVYTVKVTIFQMLQGTRTTVAELIGEVEIHQ